MWVLQPIVYGESFFIQIDSGQGLHNMWTASSYATQFYLCVKTYFWVITNRHFNGATDGLKQPLYWTYQNCF